MLQLIVEDIPEPDDGVLCNGLYLEAARWDNDLGELVQSKIGEIYTGKMTSAFWLVPLTLTLTLPLLHLPLSLSPHHRLRLLLPASPLRISVRALPPGVGPPLRPYEV